MRMNLSYSFINIVWGLVYFSIFNKFVAEVNVILVLDNDMPIQLPLDKYFDTEYMFIDWREIPYLDNGNTVITEKFYDSREIL